MPSLAARPSTTENSSQKSALQKSAFPREPRNVSLAASSKSAWWDSRVAFSQRPGATQSPISIESLVVGALAHSTQVKVLADSPLIRETAITEADANFDWLMFMESRWDDINEPVGSQLTTGGPPFFSDHKFNYSAGARRKNVLGGEFEASQQIGHENSNSIFFVPQDQGTSRLTLSYTQPLLRGRGKVYNTSLTVLAKLESESAQDDFAAGLQDHLLEITNAYWALYRDRATLLQKQRVQARASETLRELEGRAGLDALKSQIARARAAVKARQADIIRAKFSVRNSEARLRALVNDPGLGSNTSIELIPSESPIHHFIPIDLGQSIELAAQHRPEIAQAVRRIKQASVRQQMTKNELLPALNMVLSTYVNGLKGNSDIGGALASQFDEGAASYSAGLQYEVPIWNRAAHARYQRRRLEVRQLQNQFQNTVQTLQLEVKIAVREILTTYEEMEATRESMRAAEMELEQLTERWRILSGDGRDAGSLLNDLLDSQERLADQEFAHLLATVAYSQALTEHKKAIGTLLKQQQVDLARGCTCELPEHVLSKSGPNPTAHASELWSSPSTHAPSATTPMSKMVPIMSAPITPEYSPPVDSQVIPTTSTPKQLHQQVRGRTTQTADTIMRSRIHNRRRTTQDRSPSQSPVNAGLPTWYRGKTR